jgi:PAS domain S-box-containing protein
MPSTLRILFIEDNESDALLIETHLRAAGYAVIARRIETAAELAAALATGEWDVVFSDYSLPQFGSLEALQAIHASGHDLPFIIISGTAQDEQAVAALRAGAHDFIVKGRLARLVPAIERELRDAEGRREQRRAILALQTQEARSRALIEHSSDAISLLGPDGRLQYVSPSIERILGYTPHEVLGADPATLTHPDDLPGVLAVLGDLMQNPGKTVVAQYRFRHKDGSWRWLEASINNLLAEPSVGAIVFNYRDITAHQQAEFQQAELAAIVESSVDAIIGQTLDGTVTSWNSAAERMFGYTAAEMHGKSISALIPPEHADQEADILARLKAGNPIGHYEAYRLRKDGRSVQVSIAKSLTRASDGRVAGISSVDRDLTEQLRARQLLTEDKSASRERHRRRILLELGLLGIATLLVAALAYRFDLYEMLYANIEQHDYLDELPIICAFLVLGFCVFAVRRWREANGEAHQREAAQTALRLLHSELDTRVRERTADLIASNDALRAENAERERAQATLAQSEQRFRALIEKSTDGITLTDRDGLVIYDSPATARIVGGTPEDWVGGYVQNRLHPDDLAQVNELWASLLKMPGARVDAVFRYRRQDETWAWLEATATNLLAESAVQAVVINHRDITERLRAEAARKQSDATFRSLFDLMPDAVILIDPFAEGILWPIVDCNAAACRMNGYERHELIGQPIDILNLTTGKPAERQAYLQDLRQHVTTFNYETYHRRKDGQVFPVDVSTRLIHIAGRELIIGIDRDVSERKQAEAALHQTNELLSQAEQIGNIGSWKLDIAIDKVTWSDGLYDIFGLAHEEFTPSFAAYLERIHPDERERVRTITEKAFLNNAPTNFETRIVRPDGQVRFVASRARVLMDEHGRPVRLAGIEMDITDRVHAQEALAASEVQLQALFAAMTDVVLVLSAEGRYLQIPTTKGRLSSPPSEMLGRTIHEVLPAADAERVQEAIDRSLSSRQSIDWEYSVPIGDERVWFDASVSPLGPDRVIWIARDISARKLAEVRLAQERNMLRTLIDNIPDLIYAKDSASRFILANRASAASLDRTPDDVVGKTDFEMHPPELAAQYYADEQAVIQAGQPLVDREERVFIDGQERWLLTTTVPLQDAAGQVTGIVGISRDITERHRAAKRIQRQLERLAALRIIDAAIGGNTNLELILDIFLRQVIDQLGVDAADVLLLRPLLNRLEYASGHGFRTTAYRQAHVKVGEGHAGRAAMERRVIAVANLPAAGVQSRRTGILAVEGFITYYAVPLIAKGNVKGVLEIFHRTPLEPDADWLEFLEILAGQAAIGIDQAELFDDLQRSNADLSQAYDATIEGWSRALDLRDKETEGHSQRVTDLTLRLAAVIGVDAAELVHVRRGALLHDIGKMGVPDHILLKQGPLSDEEWVKMRMHPQFAYDMLAPITYLHRALDIPYCHHEKWNGTGYPRGLKGDNIPLSARIFAVVDVWDALRAERPYRQAWPVEKVVEHIRQGAGGHFDPSVVNAFLALVTASLTPES